MKSINSTLHTSESNKILKLLTETHVSVFNSESQTLGIYILVIKNTNWDVAGLLTQGRAKTIIGTM